MHIMKMKKEPDGSFMHVQSDFPVEPGSLVSRPGHQTAIVSACPGISGPVVYNREIRDVIQKRATTGAWSLGRSQPRGTLST